MKFTLSTAAEPAGFIKIPYFKAEFVEPMDDRFDFGDMTREESGTDLGLGNLMEGPEDEEEVQTRPADMSGTFALDPTDPDGGLFEKEGLIDPEIVWEMG